MNSIKSECQRRWSETLPLALLLAMTLSACDGGIFGTGDPDIDVIDISDGAADGAGGASAPGVEGGADEFDMGDGATDGTNPSRELINSLQTTARDDAVLRLLNFSDDSVVVTPSPGSEGPIAALTVSDIVPVPDATDRIEVFLSSGSMAAAFEPVSLATGSLSYILIRSSTAGATDIRAFASRARTEDDGTALARLIVAGLPDSDTSSRSSDIALVPTGDAPTGAELLLPGRESSDPIGDYVTAGAGDYSVQLSGVEPSTLTLESGASYSLVLFVDDTQQRLTVIVDSDVN